jgi:hypothetical protein
MTTVNEETAPEVQEVQEEVTQETQEQEVAETPTEEVEAEEAVKSEEEVKNSREGFWERQNRRKEENQKLKEENEYLRKLAMNQQPTHTQPSTPQVDPYEPTLDSYLEQGKTADEWAVDKFAYLESKKQKKQEVSTVQSNYAKNIQEYSKKEPQIFNKAKDVETVTIPAVQEAILMSNNPAEIIDAIHRNPDIADDLNNSRNVFELAGKLANIKIEEKKPTFSGAPKPISQPKGDPIQSGHADLSKLSKAEYIKVRNEQRKNRR